MALRESKRDPVVPLKPMFVGVEHNLLHVFGLAVTGFEGTAANRTFFL